MKRKLLSLYLLFTAAVNLFHVYLTLHAECLRLRLEDKRLDYECGKRSPACSYIECWILGWIQTRVMWSWARISFQSFPILVFLSDLFNCNAIKQLLLSLSCPKQQFVQLFFFYSKINQQLTIFYSQIGQLKLVNYKCIVCQNYMNIEMELWQLLLLFVSSFILLCWLVSLSSCPSDWTWGIV